MQLQGDLPMTSDDRDTSHARHVMPG
jgi:hypothetical protein